MAVAKILNRVYVYCKDGKIFNFTATSEEDSRNQASVIWENGYIVNTENSDLIEWLSPDNINKICWTKGNTETAV